MAIDYFKFHKDFAQRLTNKINACIDAGSIEKVYNDKLKKLRDKLNILNDGQAEVFLKDWVAKVEKDIDDTKAEKTKKLAECVKFEYNEADKALLKVYKSNPSDLDAAIAINNWFEAQGGTRVSADDAYEVYRKTFIKVAKSNTALVTDMAKDNYELEKNLSQEGFLRKFYFVLINEAIIAGTVKPQAINDDVKNLVEEAIKKAEAKKAERLAKKAKNQ